MNNRSMLRLLLLASVLICLAPAVSAATLNVAASDSSQDAKTQADYVCDGKSDQIEITNALNAAGNGGTVHLAAGTYNSDGSIKMAPGTTLMGSGEDKTRIDIRGTWDGVFANENTHLEGFTISGQGAVWIQYSHVSVQSVTVTGDTRMNGGFTVWCPGHDLTDISFKDCTAIDLTWTGFNIDATSAGLKVSNITYENCKAIRCGANDNSHPWTAGFIFAEHNDLENALIKDCYAEDNWESGFHIEPAPAVKNVVFENCTSKDNGIRKQARFPESDTQRDMNLIFGAGFFLNNGVTVKDCTAIGNHHGFMIWSSNGAKFENCYSKDSEASDYFLIHWNGFNSPNVFTNCVSENAGGYAIDASNTNDVRFENFKIINAEGVDGSMIRLGKYYPAIGRDLPCQNSYFDLTVEGGPENILYSHYGVNDVIEGTATGNYAENPFKIVSPSSGVDTSGLVIKKSTDPVDPTPTPTPDPNPDPNPEPVERHTLPGTVEAEDYDQGGEGVAYHDTDAVNEGGEYRKDGVDIEYWEKTGATTIAYAYPGEWLQYSVNVTEAGTYDVDFTVASAMNGQSVKVLIDGEEIAAVEAPNTGSWGTFTTVKKSFDLSAGDHTLKVAFDGSLNLDKIAFVQNTSSGSNPDNGSGSEAGTAVPGTIEAEDYDEGGEDVAYHDTDAVNEGGDYRQDGVDIESWKTSGVTTIAYAFPGEWLQYTIDVAEAGTYDVAFTVASAMNGQSMKVLVDGKEVETVTSPNTGSWGTFTTVKKNIDLPAGKHIIRIVFDGSLNFDKMVLSASDSSGSNPGEKTAIALPGTFEAEDYDEGGEGVAYHDTDAVNEGGDYRKDGVDIENWEKTGVTTIAYAYAGEWLQYTVDVAEAGTYDVAFTVASAMNGQSMKVLVDGKEVGTVTSPNTGSWGTFTTVKKSLELPAGEHAIRIVFDGSLNLDKVAVTAGQESVSFTIQAEDYDEGGEGVAYHDRDVENRGGAYRTDGVDIESWKDSGVTTIAYAFPGEWLQYTVDVPRAGTYDAEFVVASAMSGQSMKVLVDGKEVGTVTSPNTGSWGKFTTVKKSIALPAGEHAIRMAFGGSLNLDKFSFASTSGS
ncbi:carbohydrate-binding protein [Methanofollis aquaemaris]|uniref:Carbohydrate-binding protein n=1 Tax=Methanofollis aquaemaris TaxID=126734 RepID=A0A8A3S5C4_9EURY|nr:carbohydrate-binding protein [Methanofollis aquaemaris]QSZ67335.1 carbohydrate-binding protein [Methanofollis aquaemaris]